MIDKEVVFDQLNEGMLLERGRVFRSNLQKNLSLIGQYGGLSSVIEKFRNKNVFVVGAGPSLDAEIDQMYNLRKRQDLLIIASDMALRPLLERGIIPNFVITCETTPVDFFSGMDTSKIHLLAFSCSSRGNISEWMGDISFYNWIMVGEFYDELWEISGKHLGSVATGSIVTTQAVAIALGCEIKSLVLIGNDMAFDDKYYAAGTVSGEKLFNRADRLKSRETLTMGQVRRSREYEIVRDGCRYHTNSQFLAAKMWLEDLFRTRPCPVVDCSTPGCSGDTVLKMNLSEFSKSLKTKIRKRKK